MKHLLFLVFILLPALLMAQKPRLVAPVGHTGGITSVAFSPPCPNGQDCPMGNGKYILTGSLDESAKLWDQQGREIQNFKGHTAIVTSVVFSPNGKYVLTGSRDSTAKLFDLQGKEVQTFRGHTSWVYSVAFSPDGQFVLTGSVDKTAKLWDLSGKLLQTFSGHEEAVNSVAFSPDGKSILTGAGVTPYSEEASKDNTAKLWDLQGNIIQEFSGHSNTIHSVAFSHDGKKVLTGSVDKTAKLWDLEGNILTSFEGHSGWVNSVAISPDGKQVLTGSYDRSANLWNLEGKIIQSFEQGFSINAVAFSQDGSRVISASDDQSAKLWDLKGNEIQSFEGHAFFISSLAFSIDGKGVLMGGDKTKLWDFSSNETKSFETGLVTSLAFSPDGQQVLTGSGSKAILWDLNGKEIQSYTGHDGQVFAVAFSPDGQKVLSGSRDQTAKLWSLEGNLIHTFQGHTNSVNALTFSPNGQQVLTGSTYETILWDLQGNKVKTFQGGDVAFSPNGQMVLTGMYGEAKLWDLEGNEISSFQGHTNYVNVAFSPDGTRILTGSEDKTAKLWDLEGNEIHSFIGHTGAIYSVAFSPDMKWALTGGTDNTIKIWDIQSGKEVATLAMVDEADWVITTPSGLFDASPGAMRLLHYMQGLDVIALEQLKERYFEPHLLSKILGFNKEPLNDVAPMNKKLELYPEVSLKLQGNQLNVTLQPRGGGIGRVAFYIGNKEVADDIDPGRSTSFSINLDSYKSYFSSGRTVSVGIKAWDRQGSLESRLYSLPYTPEINDKGGPSNPGTGSTPVFESNEIHLYALCIGTGDYNGGTTLDLSYAEQDARLMGSALESAGKELFLAGAPEVTVLATCKDCTDNQGAIPTKANIKKAMEDIAAKARPQDVMILYLSGHGLTFDDYWYYLTYEMNTAVLTDETVRENRAISSKELKEWLAKIPAQKQVLMIDACHSGKLNQDFSLLAQKAIPSSQVRALNRMGSRAGLYVISASTADQVSYEASPYGMGLLTYSLLQGISGGALREGEYIDVNILFGFSEENVPKLADYISKNQKPMIYSPVDSKSFDIGKVTAGVKEGIHLSEPKPMFSKANFGDPKKFNRDHLGLTTQINSDLRDYNYKGAKSLLIFVEGDNLPQAYQLSGSYTITGESVQVDAAVFKGDQMIGEKISLTGTQSDLKKLSKELIKAAYGRVK